MAYFVALMTLLLLSPLSAATQKCNTFEPLISETVHFTERSLVVLDVDRVLIESQDATLRPHNVHLVQPLKYKHFSSLDSKQLEHLISLIYLQAKSMVIDPQAVTFIAELQKRGVPVIALTATRIGGMGQISSIQDWRLQDLKEHGISFASSFPDHPFLSLTTIAGKGPSPVFKNGILFSATYPKGDVLQAFLEKVGFIPDKVLFADDLMYNLISVTDSLTKMGVGEIYIYHFEGASFLPNDFDPQAADLQFKTLVEKERWLSDKEALEHLK